MFGLSSVPCTVLRSWLPLTGDIFQLLAAVKLDVFISSVTSCCNHSPVVCLQDKHLLFKHCCISDRDSSYVVIWNIALARNVNCERVSVIKAENDVT